MNVPWASLGLSRFAVEVGEHRVLFVGGNPQPESSAGFDPAAARIGYRTGAFGTPIDEAIEIGELVRAMFPCAVDHQVDAMLRTLGLSVERDPARAVGALFVRTIEEALRVDREVLALLAELLPAPVSEWLLRLLPVSMPDVESTALIGEVPAEPAPIDVQAVDDVLAPGGVAGRAMPQYEIREGQLQMARAVEATLRGGGALSVEAGPGTGKTFAYLVPAMLHLRRDRAARVIVCTRTKQLQEQVYQKDIPFLKERIGPDIEVAILKGRENYLCLRRWETLLQELTAGLERDRLRSLAPLVRWLFETGTGDIEENNAFLSDPESRSLWSRLYDSPHQCVGAYCAHLDECFSIQARRRARKADLVVVNHSLLLGDAATRGVVLGKYSHLVVDEAHAFEAAARAAFTASLSQPIVERLADQIAPARNRRAGWLGRLPLAPEEEDVQRVAQAATLLPGQAERLFLALAPELPAERRGRLPDVSRVRGAWEGLRTALRSLGVNVEILIERVAEEPDLAREGQGCLATIRDLTRVIEILAGEPEENSVHWYEREFGRVSLHVTPLDVAPILVERLYQGIDAAVLTSATLSLGGDFGYVERTMGLNEGFSRVDGLVADNPFSYEGRMRILVPREFPSVLGEVDAYADAVSTLLVALHRALRRNGLVLFTSHDLLQRVRERVCEAVPVLAQGIDGSRGNLLARFRREREGMLLLGADSFWEGVDLPGEELEYLVVTRLPFAVPSDPVFAALAERYERLGRDPFHELALPQAALRLRQGVGRLIRTQRDRGVVVLTDDRIRTKGYRRRFTEALPVPVEEVDTVDLLVREAAEWFSGFPREGNDR